MSSISQTITKVVISVNNNIFSIELVFNIFQRKVFADDKLDIYILTSEVDEAKQMAKCIENCCFSNMNDLIVTEDYYKAFQNANYFLLMSDSNAQKYKMDEKIKKLRNVFEKAKLFDRLANLNARVLIMGPQTHTWLQIFAEVTKNLSGDNFTGLSRHHASKALGIISRKLDCDVKDLSNVYIRGKNYLDMMNGKKITDFGSGKHGSHCIQKMENISELLPLTWINKFLLPHYMEQIKTNRHCIISAVCHHMVDWIRGTDNRIVSMVTAKHQPGQIDYGIYSSHPVVVDKHGNIFVACDIETESSLYIKLYRFHENQQKERHHIRNFVDIMNKNK